MAGEVGEAADSVQNAAEWASHIMADFDKNGLDVNLTVPPEKRAKLEATFAGRIVLQVLEALEFDVHLGKPEEKKA